MAWYDRFTGLKKKPIPTPANLLIMSGEDKGMRISAISETTYARKPLLNLEQLYFTNAIIFNAVNCWVELILSPGYSIIGQDEEARKYIEEFCEKIDLEDIFAKVINHICVYGNCFCELIYNQTKDDILDLTDPIDPKTMDFQKDPLQLPKVDDFGNPVGYVQWAPKGQRIFFDADQIVHFKLYTLGASMMGIGLIEPIFKDALGETVIAEKIGQTEFRRATPFVHVMVGDKDFHPNPSAEEINAVHNAFKNITYKTDFVGPGWIRVNFLKSEPSTSSLEAVKYFMDKEITGLGLPKSFVTGSAEQQNRATLDLIASVTQRKVQRIQKSLSHVLEDKLFKKIVELKNFHETPRLVWNEFSPESLSNKMDRMTKAIQVGLLEPDDELKKRYKRWEGLPLPERTAEELKNAPPKKKH